MPEGIEETESMRVLYKRVLLRLARAKPEGNGHGDRNRRGDECENAGMGE
jgi:hypothetical protein